MFKQPRFVSDKETIGLFAGLLHKTLECVLLENSVSLETVFDSISKIELLVSFPDC